MKFREKINGNKVKLIRSRPFIHTARDIFALVDANRDHLERWFPWVKNTVKAEDSLKFLFEKENETELFKSIGYSMVIEKRIVGHVSIFDINTKNKSGEIGYWIVKKYTKMGITTEAVKLLTNEAFDNLKLHRLQILCDENNAASAAVAQKCGFQYEGTLRENEFNDHTNSFVGSKVFSKLKTDDF